MMYLRLIGADGKQALPETFNTILSTLTYSWHDTDPWAILGKSIWEGAEVGLDRAFYEFHREMSRLYTWYVEVLRFATRPTRSSSKVKLSMSATLVAERNWML